MHRSTSGTKIIQTRNSRTDRQFSPKLGNYGSDPLRHCKVEHHSPLSILDICCFVAQNQDGSADSNLIPSLTWWNRLSMLLHTDMCIMFLRKMLGTRRGPKKFSRTTWCFDSTDPNRVPKVVSLKHLKLPDIIYIGSVYSFKNHW